MWCVVQVKEELAADPEFFAEYTATKPNVDAAPKTQVEPGTATA
jgi:hypothetical protein